MKYKDYEPIYKIFCGSTSESITSMVQAYDPGRQGPCTPLDAVLVLAKSDGLTEEEINTQIRNTAWYPLTAMDGKEATRWVIDLVAAYGIITPEMMDNLVVAGELLGEQAEQVYDLYCKSNWERSAG
jgi:hypothetical protein